VQELQFSQNVSQVFFGVNMKCASCHDSFIDTWKLTDAYSLAAVIADRPLEIYRCDKATGKIAPAGFPWPESGEHRYQATPDELATARLLVGAVVTTESVADLLWVVVMLPEFQLIR
jgi:hypothetical protein